MTHNQQKHPTSTKAIELLSHVLTSIDDARAFLHAATSCKVIQALELQSHAEQWRRLTL